MALGPSLLLPPLRDIQRRIEFVDEKYGGKMYLDVLSKEEESRIGEMGGAPRSVVYNFLSTLSEQLYRYNLLKSMIISEKRLKVGLITMLLVLCWILTISLLCALIYFVIYPGFDKYRKINSLDGSLIMTLQYAYFGGIAIVLSAYVIFMTSIFYQKYKKIFDVHYEVESTFNTEPSVQHLVSMMNVLDKNMHVNVSSTRNLRCQGSNPLVGYFIHQNRGIDVRYDCLPTSIIATPEVKNGCVGGGGGPNSVTRKSYNFSNNRKVPYVLTKDSLLNSKNLPCAIFEKRSDKLFVDPFIGKNSLVGNPKVLKKKLDKFDLYGQSNMINNAVLYFETILSRDAIGTSAFQEEIKNEIVVHMKSLLDLSHLIVTTNLTPAITFLDKLPPQRKRELISKDEFFFLCMYLPISYAYYDTSRRTGFFLDESDLNDMVLIFTPRSGQGQNQNSGDGNIDLNMSVVKRNRTPMGLESPTLNIGIENLPAKSMIDGLFKPSKVYDRESNMAFEADIDTSKGTISRRYEDSLLTPKQSNPESAPEYVKLFNLSLSNQKTTLKPVMFIYQMTLETFIVQSRNNFLANMYNSLKDVLLSSIVDKIGQIDSTYNLEIDFRMERDVRIHLEQQFGNDFNLLFNEFTDMINEIPVLMGVKRKEKAQKTGTDPDDIMNKYITFDMFMLALQSMKQEDFLDRFLFNLDALRHTSAGLKQMNDKYNYGFAVEEKNKIMFEVSFYVLVIVGMAELFRLSGLRYIDFRCETMSLEEEMLDAEKRYRNAVDDDEDVDKRTRQSIMREMENLKEDIMRSMVKARNYMILYISILFFIYIFSVSLLYAWKEKTRHVFNYNKYVMNTNGNQIVTDSEHSLQTIVQLITEEKQFFFLSSNYKESGDPDELFHLLSKHAQIQKNEEIIWTMPPRTSTEGDSPLKRTYMRLINTIENYKKCNMLVDSRMQQIPFPLIDTITYIMLLLMVIGVLLFAAFKLTPLEHYNNLLNWRHIKELMDQGIEIDPISFDFICHEDDDSKKISYNAITLIVAIIIVIMGILLALSLFRNSSQFATNLYSSDLFSEMKCYD